MLLSSERQHVLKTELKPKENRLKRREKDSKKNRNALFSKSVTVMYFSPLKK